MIAPKSRRQRWRWTGHAFLACALAFAVALGVGVPRAWASEPTPISGSARSLLDAIPILPKMTQGYVSARDSGERDRSGRDQDARDGRGCTLQQRAIIARAIDAPKVSGPRCSITAGSWLADFGASQVTSAKDLRLVSVIGPGAAWASGAYSWTPAQRASFASDLAMDPSSATYQRMVTVDGSQPASPQAAVFAKVPWAAASTLLTASIASRVQRACARSSSAICVLEAVPDQLKPRVAAAIVAVAVRHRLSMTRVEKAALEPWIDHFIALDPDGSFAIRTTNVPALPTTDGSDATGRVVDANLFGLLAPPVWNSTPNVPYATLRLWDSGVLWKDIEPSPGRFTWATLDYAVRTAESQGKKVLLVLGPVPAWASADPDAPDESWGKGAAGPFVPDGLADFERYVTAVVNRYGDRIWAYETWNEANLQTFWKGTPAQMAVMTKVVYDAIKAKGASSLTLGASATTRTEGSIYRFFPAYLRELGKRGWPVDGYAVHAYPDADGTPSDVADFVAQYKAYLAIAGAPVRPIYNTELNYGLAGPGDKPHRDMNAEQSAGWLARTFIDSVRLGIEETHWFAWTPKYYGQYGIQLTPTSDASGEAWRTTYAWLVGATFQSCREPEGAVICAFSRDGKPFWLAYGDSTELIDAPAGATQWCDLRGVCRPIDGSMVIVGIRPIRIS